MKYWFKKFNVLLLLLLSLSVAHCKEEVSSSNSQPMTMRQNNVNYYSLSADSYLKFKNVPVVELIEKANTQLGNLGLMLSDRNFLISSATAKTLIPKIEFLEVDISEIKVSANGLDWYDIFFRDDPFTLDLLQGKANFRGIIPVNSYNFISLKLESLSYKINGCRKGVVEEERKTLVFTTQPMAKALGQDSTKLWDNFMQYNPTNYKILFYNQTRPVDFLVNRESIAITQQPLSLRAAKKLSRTDNYYSTEAVAESENLGISLYFNLLTNPLVSSHEVETRISLQSDLTRLQLDENDCRINGLVPSLIIGDKTEIIKAFVDFGQRKLLE